MSSLCTARDNRCHKPCELQYCSLQAPKSTFELGAPSHVINLKSIVIDKDDRPVTGGNPPWDIKSASHTPVIYNSQKAVQL